MYLKVGLKHCMLPIIYYELPCLQITSLVMLLIKIRRLNRSVHSHFLLPTNLSTPPPKFSLMEGVTVFHRMNESTFVLPRNDTIYRYTEVISISNILS
jgi:hypothetical protein